jgi:hypothetical protein
LLLQDIFKNIERTGTERHMSLAFLDFSGHEVVLTGQHEDIIILRENGDLEVLDTTEFGFPVGLEPDIQRFVASKTYVEQQRSRLMEVKTNEYHAGTEGTEIHWRAQCGSPEARLTRRSGP